MTFAFDTLVIGNGTLTTSGNNLYINGTIINGPGGSTTWGAISGSLSNQTDLSNSLLSKGLNYAYSPGGVSQGQFSTNNSILSAVTEFTFGAEDFLGASNPFLALAASAAPNDYFYVASDASTCLFQITSVNAGSSILGVTSVGGNGNAFINGEIYSFNLYKQTILSSTTSAIQKSNGAGLLTDAVVGTDYVTPTTLTAGSTSAIQRGDGTGGITNATAGADYAAPNIPLSTVLSNSSITPIADGNYTLSSTLGGSISFVGGIVTAFSPAT